MNCLIEKTIFNQKEKSYSFPSDRFFTINLSVIIEMQDNPDSEQYSYLRHMQ